MLSPTYSPFQLDSDDRDAWNIIREKSRDLAAKFSDVKVEFSDLDGMRWKRGRSTSKQQSKVSSISNAAAEVMTSPGLSARRHKRDKLVLTGGDFRPPSIITPPLCSPTSPSYFPLQRKSSLGRAAAGIKKSLSFKRKKEAQNIEPVVPILLPALVSNDSDSDEDSILSDYSGGAELCRSGSSIFVSPTVDVESDFDSSSLEESVEDLDYPNEDDVETPRPLTVVRKVSCNSYFDCPYDGIEEESISASPMILPTVPAIPSLDPEVDLSAFQQPTLPSIMVDLDPNETIKASRVTPIQKRRLSPLPFFSRSSSSRKVYPTPSPPSPPISRYGSTATTSLTAVSVQVSFAPMLNQGEAAHGFWSTDCVSKDSQATIRPMTRRGLGQAGRAPGLGDLF